MRRRLLVALAFLTACAAPLPVRVPESAMDRTDKPVRLTAPPRTGPFDAPDSRRIEIEVVGIGSRVLLSAWGRLGVWTTMQQVRFVPFVTRETWGKLGKRKPRLLARVTDEAIAGVIARVRPETDGRLTFLVEIAEVEPGPRRTVGIYHGQRVTLSPPRRHGYRFEGVAPADWRGAIARWGLVTVYHGCADSLDAPPGAVRFRGTEEGFVAGRGAAEAFVETWEFAKPIHVQADGVQRKDFRLRPKRSAAGFQKDGSTYGGRIVLTR